MLKVLIYGYLTNTYSSRKMEEAERDAVSRPQYHYQAQNCEGCPMSGPCHRGKGNRVIEANPRLIRYKDLIRIACHCPQPGKTCQLGSGYVPVFLVKGSFYGLERILDKPP